MIEKEMKVYSRERLVGEVYKALESRGPLPSKIDLVHYDYIAAGHLNSLSLLQFIAELEEHFNIEFSDSDLASSEFRTVGGVAAIIAHKKFK